MTLRQGILRLDTLRDIFATNQDVEDKLQLERADTPRRRVSLTRLVSWPNDWSKCLKVW